jgi:hypothetical protein
MKAPLAIVLPLALLFSSLAVAGPADMISDFRLKQGEGRVTPDATLERIALEQAKDVLDHEVLGSFSSRIAPAKSGRAAENIAYGYDSFDKTLNQWIGSTGHRKNLLLHKASRIGVASAKSATSSRTYWAMVIAGGYEPSPKGVAKGALSGGKRKTPVQACRAKILNFCF